MDNVRKPLSLLHKMTEIRWQRYLAIGLLAAASQIASAQQARISLNLQNVPIKEALKAIESKCDYTFLYNNAAIDVNRKVSISANNEELKNVLGRMLDGVTWTVENKRIILSPAKAENTEPAKAASQLKLITGTVLDEKGEPMIGVSVNIPGTNRAAVTNIEGRYQIKAAPGETLNFSYIGYLPEKAKVGTNDEVNVSMAEDTQNLEDLVVVGYGVQKKVNLSGSVSTFNTKMLNDRPVVNIGQALQGAVANFNVNVSSGQPDSSPSYNVRGYTSINGGSPLVVIDGVVSTADILNRLNPNDIENISILKDASSAAIYGSRAAFGVILVTTKKGKGEKLTVSYGNNFVWHKNSKLPDIITDPYIVATTRNKMAEGWHTFYDEEDIAYAKRVSEDPSLDPYYTHSDGSVKSFGHTNWLDELFKKSSFSMLHNIAISGQTERVNYYLSASYNDQGGIIRPATDKYKRYNVRSKLDFKLTNWWNLGANINYINSTYDYPQGMSWDMYWNIIRSNPLELVHHPDGSWTDTSVENIGTLTDGGRSVDKKGNVDVMFTTKIDILKDVLWVNGSYAYSNTTTRSNWYNLPVPYRKAPGLPIRYYNLFTKSHSDASNSSSETWRSVWDAYITFNKTFAQKHAVTALAGFNQEEYHYDYSRMNRVDLITGELPTVALATGEKNLSQSKSSWATRGAFFRLNYTFDNRYIFEFNGRYDGTSRFQKSDRFVFNPSASAAWVISNENFFEPLKPFVTNLKIYGSYGRLGNQDVSTYAYIATMGAWKINQILDGEKPLGIWAPGLVSGSLTWEKVTTGNIGADIYLLNNRLNINGEYYERRTTDMLTKGQTLPGVLGASVPDENAANLKTKGWEITVNWRDHFMLADKPFNYTIGFNIADSRAWITKFSNPTGTLNDYYEGQELGEIWGLETEGFFTSQEDIDNHADQSWSTSYPGLRPLGPGDLKFKDQNNDNVIDRGNWTLEDHGDFKVIGNSRARYTYGITATAQWNGFDLSMFFQGVGRKHYYPGTHDCYFWGCYYQPYNNITIGNWVDRWTEENPNGYFPRLKSYVAEDENQELGLTQTRYLQNAAYIRLKNLTVGYSLPTALLNKVGIESFRIFFTGENLWESSKLYKYFKVDPETLGNLTYPMQRSYSFGVNLTF